MKTSTLLLVLPFFLFATSCVSQKSARTEHYKEIPVFVDTIKVTLPLYEVIDTSLFKLLEFAQVHTDTVFPQKQHPVYFSFCQVVKKEGVEFFLQFSESLFVVATDAYNGIENYIGAFYYGKYNDIVVIEKTAIFDKEREFEDSIIKMFRNTGKTIDFYPKAGFGETSLFRYTKEEDKFSLLYQDDGLHELWAPK